MNREQRESSDKSEHSKVLECGDSSPLSLVML